MIYFSHIWYSPQRALFSGAGSHLLLPDSNNALSTRKWLMVAYVNKLSHRLIQMFYCWCHDCHTTKEVKNTQNAGLSRFSAINFSAMKLSDNKVLALIKTKQRRKSSLLYWYGFNRIVQKYFYTCNFVFVFVFAFFVCFVCLLCFFTRVMHMHVILLDV